VLEKVSLFIRKVTRLADVNGKAGRICIMDVNGMPALLSEIEPPRTDFSPRQVFLLDVDEAGRVERIYTVLAADKLKALDFSQVQGIGRVPELLVRGVRALMRIFQRPEQRLTKHLQVHPGSRVRPREPDER